MKHFDVCRSELWQQYFLGQPRLLKHWSEECRGAFWSYLPLTSLPKKSPPTLKSAASLSVFLSPPTGHVHAVQLHNEIVHTWMCLLLRLANEHWVKCRPSCVLTGTGGVPLRSHFRTHGVLGTFRWSSVIYSVFVTIPGLTDPYGCQLHSVLIRRLLFISHCRLRWSTVIVGFLLTSCWRSTHDDFWWL